MTLNLSAPGTENQLKPRIVVIGVGGAGCNAVNNMISSNLEGVEFVVANTDAQSLSLSASERRIQLGINITNGLGAGARPDIGRAAAEESIDVVLDHLQGSHMAFIAAGMGGGTGTGAAPVIARAAREQGILTVGVVTKPFQFEGNNRMKSAEEGIEELQHFVDTLIVIPNQNLFRVCNEHTTFADAFCMADNVLHSGVRGVTDLMVMPGLINLDFADIRTVMSEMGKAMMGTGESTGEGRSIAAAEAAIANPLLDDVSMRGARGVLINITGGLDMTLFEVDEAANRIREEVDSDANIIFGSTFDEKMDGTMRVSIVSTGIDAEPSSASRSPMISLVHDSERSRNVQASDRALTTENIPDETINTELVEPKSNLGINIDNTTAETDVENSIKAELDNSNNEVNQAEELLSNEQPFIPPRAVNPEESAARPQVSQPSPNAFAEAAIENRVAQVEKRRGRSLFQKVTGAVNRKVVEEEQTVNQKKLNTDEDKTNNTSVLEKNATINETSMSDSESSKITEDQPILKSELANESLVNTKSASKYSSEKNEPSTPTQTSLSDLDPTSLPEAQATDDDMLEIPAFLRRQAN